jgi:hypothetical protein
MSYICGARKIYERNEQFHNKKTIIGRGNADMSDDDLLRAPYRYENKITNIYGPGRERTYRFSQIKR